MLQLYEFVPAILTNATDTSQSQNGWNKLKLEYVAAFCVLGNLRITHIIQEFICSKTQTEPKSVNLDVV